MTRLELIIEEAKRLSPEERERLIDMLKRQAFEADDDAAVGQRGLAYLTESTRDEDWSAFYPESLRHQNRGEGR